MNNFVRPRFFLGILIGMGISNFCIQFIFSYQDFQIVDEIVLKSERDVVSTRPERHLLYTAVITNASNLETVAMATSLTWAKDVKKVEYYMTSGSPSSHASLSIVTLTGNQLL